MKYAETDLFRKRFQMRRARFISLSSPAKVRIEYAARGFTQPGPFCDVGSSKTEFG
jgi:hypothetical protein